VKLGVQVKLAKTATYGAGHDFERVIALKLNNGKVATFTDGERAVTMPLNKLARTKWELGSAAREGSPVAVARDKVADMPEHQAAIDCAKAQ
jgi:hypothetical protein